MVRGSCLEHECHIRLREDLVMVDEYIITKNLNLFMIDVFFLWDKYIITRNLDLFIVNIFFYNERKYLFMVERLFNHDQEGVWS